MMTYTTPENVGVSTDHIKELLGYMEDNHMQVHSVIMARGNEIFFERYWEPFNKDYLHRMYSVSKSFVSLAIGFLEQDGKISLDDKISMYFPEEMKNQTDENFKNQTIRNMLMMSTAKLERNWFLAKPDDRVRFYFENDIPESRPGGTIFQYDSTGSFVLGALVERITGMPYMDYLKEKFLNKLDASPDTYCLKCPGGHSWGDSGVMMRTIDLMKTARFVMNGGNWEGEQLLNEDYVKTATSSLIDSRTGLNLGHNAFGYGYLFRRTYNNSFFFSGAMSQIAVCSPDKDLIFVMNGCTDPSRIMEHYFRMIYNKAKDSKLPEYKGEPIGDSFKLTSLKNQNTPAMQERINGKKFIMQTNKMGISDFTINFVKDGKCEFNYHNAQGDKTLYFRMGENEFGLFPEEGYSDEIGTVYAPGNYYKCAASAKWTSDNQLLINIQIIDKYFGYASFTLSFTDDGKAGVRMCGAGEYFLTEYNGYCTAVMAE